MCEFFVVWKMESSAAAAAAALGLDVPRKIGATIPSSLFAAKGPAAVKSGGGGKKKKGIDCLIEAAAFVEDAAAAATPAVPSTVLKTLAQIVEGTSDAEMEIMAEYASRILNEKEVRSDELVARIVAMVEAQIPPHMDSEEKRQTLERAVLAKLSAASSCLKLKLAPLAKAYLNQREDEEMDGLFYNMVVPQMTRREKARIYGIMFARFMDDLNCVSFATGNPRMLGNLAPADVWFLTFFVFVTCRRVRGDNLLQLGCTGISSCGKSTLLESVIRRTAHQLLSSSSSSGGDAGVGRFEVGKKNTILLHDVTIGKLFGVDFEKIKAISRAETTVAKIHSHVAVLPPLHLIYTSNQRLQDHSIRTPSLFAEAAAAAKAGKRTRMGRPPPPPPPSSTVKMTAASQVGESLGGLKKHTVSLEDLKAIKNRFLEMYVHKKPFQEEAHLNLSEPFDRLDFIVGTFERALSVLERHFPGDFASPHLYGYVIGALKKNSLYYEEVMKGLVDGEEDQEAPVVAAADDDNAVLKFYVDDDGQLRHVDYDNDDNDVDDDDDANDDDDESDWELLPPHQAPMTPPPPPPPTTPTPTDGSSGDDKYQQHYVWILKLVDLYSIH